MLNGSPLALFLQSTARILIEVSEDAKVTCVLTKKEAKAEDKKAEEKQEEKKGEQKEYPSVFKAELAIRAVSALPIESTRCLVADPCTSQSFPLVFKFGDLEPGTSYGVRSVDLCSQSRCRGAP